MIYYVYSEDNQEFIEKNKLLEVWTSEINYLTFSHIDELDVDKASHLLVTGCLEEIKVLIEIAHKNDIGLGIIPTPEQKELKRTFELPKKIEDAIVLALTPSEKKLDVLCCNDTIVLQEVVIGDAPPLDHFDTVLKGKTFFAKIKIFWLTIRKVKDLKHTKMKITLANDNVINLSAVGIVGVEYSNATFAAKLVSSQLSANDGKLSIVILSPSSMLQYVSYLFTAMFSLGDKSLPASVGYISSKEMTIEPKNSLTVRIDSSTIKHTPAVLKVKEEVLGLSVGEQFWEKQNKIQSTKDSIKIDHLPSDDENAEYLSKAIPLFSHASQEQYTSLFSSLREESKLSTSFMILLILSTMIATFGLFINSSSVVIGAMLLAPLMQPIVSLSMGVLRQDSDLEFNAAKTIFWGVLAVLLTAAVISLFTPIERLTTEMAGRLSPTILDLFVAIASGAAAAYAKSNEKIIGSLAGVAIAVALVPPLAVAGIGLGWGNWHMFSMSFLLFVTNLVGIVLSAAFTFVLLGFSPLAIARKGIMIWMSIVFAVAIPLYSSFDTMKEDIQIQ
ncbi:MAG: TIGR00341 family protein, partial [Sulfurovum sp.]|nr:TIGR00341 family protein [Sulfurovum sp.]